MEKENIKKKLLISFSGGATSAFMMWWMLNEWPDRDKYEIIIVFANTGKEAPETLVFVHRCQWQWNIPIVWVEAVHLNSKGKPISKKGWQVKHKIVDYFTASRAVKLADGTFSPTPFEEMLSILGIPSTNAPFCSDQLKRKAIESYCKSIGWKDYYKAIGLRKEETNRMNPKFLKKKILYPLIFINPKNKAQINEWFKDKAFKLEVDSDLGNCDNCWKKDLKRLTRNTKNYPETFEWWDEMTTKYGKLNPRNSHLKPPFNFYRGNLSVKDLFEVAKLKDRQIELFAYKEGMPRCGESCEAF